jgi:hypothetical protein
MRCPAAQLVPLTAITNGLLDDGHDIEGDNGDGWTLLRRAIHAEADRHARTGDPLHADMTAFLLARGADPHAPDPRTISRSRSRAARALARSRDHPGWKDLVFHEPGQDGR